MYRTFERAFDPVAADHATADNSGGHEELRGQVVELFCVRERPPDDDRTGLDERDVVGEWG